MEQDQNSGVNHNVALLLTDRLKEAWRNFMEEFQQSFDLTQFDSVLSLLRELECTSQNPTKKKRLEFMQKGDGESEDNNINDSSSLEKKVFGNHLLAKSVFKHLSVSDLFSCRLMNSYWNEYATEILLETNLKIKFGTIGNRIYLHGSNWKSLDMFTELLKRSKNFPCNKFEFYDGNLGNDDAQRFLSFYGANIKYLKISFLDHSLYNCAKDKEAGFSNGWTESRVMGEILSEHLPNLERVELDLRDKGYAGWSGHESLLFPPEKEVKLPNLKQLVYDSGCHSDYFENYIDDSDGQHGDDFLLRQLLLAATNLTRFEKPDEWFDLMKNLDDFTATGKANCVTELLFPTEVERLEKLEELLKYEPKVTSISLFMLYNIYNKSETWKRISIILTKLLESSKKSLCQIQNFKSLGFLGQLQLPVLENVTDLLLKVPNESRFNPQDIHGYSFALLPRGATFSVNFPKLKFVKLSLWSLSATQRNDPASWWTKYFPTEEIVPTVKKLKLLDSCPLLWVEKLTKMFPNLEDLSVSDIQDFPNFSKIIWTSCRKLKSLAVEIDLASPFNAHPALDSGFTGLSPEVCNQLGDLSPSELESVAENYMENEPSLLDLTDLRNIYINLDFSMSFENYNYPPILTPLSGICVFKPLKSLQQVTIQYSTHFKRGFNESLIRQNLEPLIPYKVKIENAIE